jgi:hypothetical protein
MEDDQECVVDKYLEGDSWTYLKEYLDEYVENNNG